MADDKPPGEEKIDENEHNDIGAEEEKVEEGGVENEEEPAGEEKDEQEEPGDKEQDEQEEKEPGDVGQDGHEEGTSADVGQDEQEEEQIPAENEKAEELVEEDAEEAQEAEEEVEEQQEAEGEDEEQQEDEEVDREGETDEAEEGKSNGGDAEPEPDQVNDDPVEDPQEAEDTGRDEPDEEKTTSSIQPPISKPERRKSSRRSKESLPDAPSVTEIPSEPISNTQVPVANRKTKKRSVTCLELATRNFADSVLRTGLFRMKGSVRIPGENNRVIILVGEKDRSRDWVSVVSGILQASAHADAIIVDKAGSRSVFNSVRANNRALPDIIGIGSSSTTTSCQQHRVSIIADKCVDESSPAFIQAKLDLAQNLAGPFKVVLLNVCNNLGKEQEELLKLGSKRGWPVLSLFDCPRPAGISDKYAAFPKSTKDHESEFASFIHIHLTVDLFAFN